MTLSITAKTLAELGPGSLIARRYEIVRFLGAGGFATVFAAFDREIEREVAIKVLNLAAMANGPSEDVEPFLERFRREARLAARIRHPNVVEIYDFGVLSEKSNPYMIMEMLDGHDLEEEIGGGKGMEPARAIPLFCGALDALGEAHRLGIVHKDLKPANLFLNRPGTRREVLKIVDFGIAHIGESNEGRMTQTGAMFGTPQYLSPEYVQTQVVTPGMDVYQMGLILVELLTGRPVINENNPWQCAVKHVTRDINLPVALLDGPMGPIIKRALEYEVSDRFADATQFADALSRVDPTLVEDIRASDTPYRKLDSDSGQFVPAPQNSSDLAYQNTGEMPGAPRPDSRSLGQSTGAASTGMTLPMGTNPALIDTQPPTESPEAPARAGLPRSAVILLLLFAVIVASAGLWWVISSDSVEASGPEAMVMPDAPAAAAQSDKTPSPDPVDSAAPEAHGPGTTPPQTDQNAPAWVGADSARAPQAQGGVAVTKSPDAAVKKTEDPAPKAKAPVDIAPDARRAPVRAKSTAKAGAARRPKKAARDKSARRAPKPRPPAPKSDSASKSESKPEPKSPAMRLAPDLKKPSSSSKSGGMLLAQ